MRRPTQGRRTPRWATSTEAIEIILAKQPKGKTTESLSCLCLPSHPRFPRHRIMTINRRTHGCRTFLGDAIVRIFQSFTSRKTSNKAALPPQHRLHQRLQHPRPHIDSIGSSRLCFDHFRTTEKRQEIRHRHAMENVQPHHVPGQTLGFNYHSDPFIQRHKPELTRLSCTTQKQHHQYHIGDGRKSSQRWHRCNW